MFATIVWATDGSTASDRALPYAKALAARENARLVALHADEHSVGRAWIYPVPDGEDEIGAKIHEQIEEVREEGIDASFIVVHGNAQGVAQMIADAAREVGADVIVAGHRDGLVAELLGESVAQRLMRLAPCPVLVVPPPARDSAEPREHQPPVAAFG